MSTSGLSRARLSRMHDVMSGYVEREEVPGLVTLVSRRGEIHVDLIGTQAFASLPSSLSHGLASTVSKTRSSLRPTVVVRL